MHKPAIAYTDDAESKMKESASPEEMERRRLVASRLRALIDRPITEAEAEFWQEFETELEKDRLALRSREGRVRHG